MMIDQFVNYAQVLISPELFAGWFVTGWHLPREGDKGIRCIEGIPADAKYIRGFYDSVHDRFGMIFEHSSFQAIRAGDQLPDIKVVFQTEHEE